MGVAFTEEGAEHMQKYQIPTRFADIALDDGWMMADSFFRPQILTYVYGACADYLELRDGGCGRQWLGNGQSILCADHPTSLNTHI